MFTNQNTMQPAWTTMFICVRPDFANIIDTKAGKGRTVHRRSYMNRIQT